MKKHNRKRPVRWLMTALLLVFGLMLMPGKQSEVKAAVRINYSSIKLAQGTTQKLKIRGTGRKAKWSSSNSKVATVDQKSGKVTAIKGGKATITAKVGSRKLKCNVTVVGISATKLTIKKGSSYTFKVKNGKNTTWKTTNKSVVTVSSKGKIKAKGTGSATIVCKTNGRTLKCKVYVPAISATTLRVPMGTYRRLTVTKKGGNTPQWSSSNPAVATVDANGYVVSKSLGYTTVSCKVGSATLTCSVQVTNPGNIVTPMSALPLKSNEETYSVTVEGYETSRTYAVYGQQAACNQSQKYPSYINAHGCAACSTATVLNGYKGLGITPSYVIEGIEKNLFGTAYTDNYKKKKYMPVSLYGISRILSSYGINNQYVRSFSDAQALAEITQHLKTGNAVVIEVKKFNRSTGKNDTTWSNSYHTMVLLGMTDSGMAIVADSMNRPLFGNCQRIKYATVASLIPYMFSCSNTTSTSCYFTSSGGGGYILVNPE